METYDPGCAPRVEMAIHLIMVMSIYRVSRTSAGIILLSTQMQKLVNEELDVEVPLNDP